MNAEPNTPAPVKRKRGQRTWTDAQRAELARKTRERQIWLKSTGPRTFRGKRISSRNSYKHGYFAFETQVLRWYVRLAALRLKQLKTVKNLNLQKRRNELINARYHAEGIPVPPKPDVNAFYPYFKVHPLDAAWKPRPKNPLHPQNPKKRTERQIAQDTHDYFTNLADLYPAPLPS